MNVYQPETPPSKVFEAVVERLVAAKRVPEWLLRTDKCVFADIGMDVTLAMEKKFLMLETVEESVNITIPTTWFQHWKRDNAPQWVLKRWPVKYSTVFVPKVIRKCCPHVDIPDRTTHFRFLETGL